MIFSLDLSGGGLVVSRYVPNGVGDGSNSFPSGLVGYKLCLREQVVAQLRGMHLMIDATLKSAYGQVVGFFFHWTYQI